MRISFYCFLPFLCLLGFSLYSCTGYQLGGSVPRHLQHLESIAIPQFENKTLNARLSPLVTNTAIDALLRDGTYKIAPLSKADAVLHGVIESVDYDQYSASRQDSLASDELSMKLKIKWKLVSAQGRLLDSGVVTGKTNFFVSTNQQTAKKNAVPIAAQRAARQLITEISQGF